MSEWDKLSKETEKTGKVAPTQRTTKKVDKPTSDISNGTVFCPIQEIAGATGIKVATHGRPKTGKTLFCMTASDWKGNEFVVAGPPVFYIETQFGTKQFERRFAGKPIYITRAFTKHPETQEENCVASMQKVDKALNEAMANVRQIGHGTIVIDSFTDIMKWLNWILRVHVLKVDAKADIKPKDYYWRNSKVTNLFMELLEMPGNVIITAEDKEVWEDARGTPTGRYKPQWYEKVPYWVDFSLSLVKEYENNRWSYSGHVDESRYQKSTEFVTISNPTFPKLIEAFEGAF